MSPSPKDARCLPKDVAAYALQWKPPAPRQHVCTDEQIAAITPCATGHSGAPICSTRFAAAGTAEDLACERCVLTHDSDATWGATVHLADRRIFLNSAGCIALLEPSREACARDEQATHECVAVACYAGCFTNPKISESDKNACAEAAALGGCKPYAERATLCRVSLGQSHSAAEACLVEFDDAGFQTIARLFCGK